MSNTKKLEYDASLGGSVVLPTHVATYRYAASALAEMKDLLDDKQQQQWKNSKLIFQTLPKHMRRRAMSHHPKRLPRKYRAAHISQMSKAGKPKDVKRPSRKFRRRPQNLLQDYLRRQRNHIWLETHLWHAKRFHMVNRWGYRLPYASCDKTYRACYRATTQHCLLQDISYYACLELSGNLEQLRIGFARLSSSECGLGITAKTYLSGKREGSIELFCDGAYPLRALGRVSFMWRPAEAENTRTLWLWLHPSAYQATLEQLLQVFELNLLNNTKVPIEQTEELESEENNIKTVETKKPRVKATQRLQFMTRTVGFERVRNYTNATNTLHLRTLKDTLNRFRLTGPLAQSVLAAALKPYKLEPNSSPNWLSALYTSDKNFESQHTAQAAYWEKATQLSAPSELLSNMILALNVCDTRLQRPARRKKAVPASGNEYNNNTAHELLLQMPDNLHVSALWNAKLRDELCQQMLSTKIYCDLRAKHAIAPGAPCNFERDMQPIPLLLIQRPGAQQHSYKRLGYGCGWDIIAPAGYGMNIWMTLIMFGARPGGLREFETIAREAGSEQHLPDTLTGRQQSLETAAELRTKYFRLPTNKRCNYRKFAVISPFRAPFAQLVRDWLPDDDNNENENKTTVSYFILRNREMLQSLDYNLQKHRRLPTEVELPANALIQIQLRLKTRGKLQANALICLPTRADFKQQLKQIKHDNRAPIYTEPLLADANEKERGILRRKHKQLLKRLRARRVREKRKRQETATRRVHIRPANTAQLVAKHLTEMSELWLPSNATDIRLSVRKQATREVIGYITSANFSLTEATVCAVGYVTTAGLRELIEICSATGGKQLRQPIMCLVRDTKTRNYRFATFKVNLAVAMPPY